METIIVYLLKSTACLTFFYISYFLFLRKESGFKFIRIYLVSSVILSLLLPLNHYSIGFTQDIIPATVQQQYENTSIVKKETSFTSEVQTNPKTQIIEPSHKIDFLQILQLIYITVLIGILISLLLGVLNILRIYIQSKQKTIDNTRFFVNEKLNHSFSFMNLVFINTSDLNEKEVKSIITHENIHVSQYHYIDLLLIELVAAVMWFNPVVWYMRKSIRQIHEYLADEGVLNTGFDRLEYQALLINQVAESRLLSLASSFNHSLIKKRIIMMTTLKSDNRTKVKLLLLVPVAVLLFLGVSCLNDQKNVITAVEPVRMNVLYIGVDNPIRIAASGYESSDLDVTIDNGTIEGKNGEFIVNPKEKGKALVTVSCKGKIIQQSTFRAKYVPDPVACIALPVDSKGYNQFKLKKGGGIRKEELIASGGIVAAMENFDFDLSFKVVEFLVTTVKDGFAKIEPSKSDRFTQQQIDLIQKQEIGLKVYLEDIKAIGPDGFTRNLGTLAFTIE